MASQGRPRRDRRRAWCPGGRSKERDVIGYPTTPGSTLSAVRIAFSIWLAAAHACHTFLVTDPAALWLKQTSFVATDIFILLSAVSLSLRYTGTIPVTAGAWLQFMFRRVSRIWPVHALTLAAMAAVSLVSPGPMTAAATASQVQAWLCQMALVQAWGIPSDWTLWNSPTWTLSALIVCYALYPFLRRLSAWLNRPRWLFFGALGLYGGLWLAAVALGYNGYGGLLAVPQQVGVLRAVPLFALGVLAVPVVRSGSWIPKSRVLDTLGDATFCLYVIHWPLLKLMENHGLQGWGYCGLSILVLVAMAHLVRRFVDAPLQQLLRGFEGRIPWPSPAPVKATAARRSRGS